MKKFFLPLLTLAVTTVTLASCNKNDDYVKSAAPAPGQIGQIKPTVTYDDNQMASCVPSIATYHGKCFFISDAMAQLATFKVQVTDGTKTSEYDIATQGKHDTYKIFTDGKKVQNVSGFCLEVIMPTKSNLKSHVTFTPKGQASHLNADDKVEVAFFTSSAAGNSSKLEFKHNGKYIKDMTGSAVIAFCSSAAQKMSDM